MDGTGGRFAIGDTDRVLTDEDRRRAFGRLIDDGLERAEGSIDLGRAFDSRGSRTTRMTASWW